MGRRVGLALAILLLAGCGAVPDRAAVQPQADVRKIVFTAGMTVRVGDAARAAGRAADIATAAGGTVFASSVGRSDARLTIEVPPARFEPVLDQLGALGTSTRRNVKAQDVTTEVADVDSRLRTAQASVERLRTLLGEARTATDLVVVEAELAKRESELEALQGKQRVLNHQVDLATIELRLAERTPGFGESLRTGWDAMGAVLAGATAVAGYLVPFTPLVLGGTWALRRRRRACRDKGAVADSVA